MRDDDIIRRAELWATGSTIHDVKGLIGLYRSAIHVLDNPDSFASEQIEHAEELCEVARCTLEDFMRSGDYRKARTDNLLPDYKEKVIFDTTSRGNVEIFSAQLGTYSFKGRGKSKEG